MNDHQKTNFATILGLGVGLLVVFSFFSTLLSQPEFRRQRLFDPNAPLVDTSASDSELVAKGLEYLSKTSQLLPQHVGAKINCTSCHINLGKTPYAGPWVNVTKIYPKYRKRSGHDVDLAGRINGCFQRSLNGKPLDKNHPAMRAMIAYMKSLEQESEFEGQGVQKLILDSEPDIANGKKVYEAKCSRCHQSDGRGQILEDGLVVYPPLWGKDSFNIGAGMARLHTAAGFVKNNMPLGEGGTLSDQDAWDVAFYFSTQPRPDFSGKDKDWPKGGKPKDARY